MPRLYLDTCCLNRPFDDQSQERVREETWAILLVLAHVALGIWEGIGSDVVDQEVAKIRDPARRLQVQRMARAGTIYVTAEPDHALRGFALEALGFSTYDALHIACAESAGADVLLTTDDAMLSRSRRVRSAIHVRVENPVTWMQEEDLR
jgi:predicted nucleic acid-binding protein